MDERDEGRKGYGPSPEQEGDLHPAPESPIQSSHPQEERREQIRGEPVDEARGSASWNEERPRREAHPEGTGGGDDGGPEHQALSLEAGEVSDREDERIGEARVTRRVPVT